MKLSALLSACVVGVMTVASLADVFPRMPDAVEVPGNDAPAANPGTYPDDAGFKERSQRVINVLAQIDLGQWRRGYFSGGDPGKYLPNAAMARMILDPNDAEVRKYMNDDRSYQEHYHFAALNWARFYPLFGEQVLTDDTDAKLKEAAFRYGGYLNQSGTDNHRTQSRFAASVLPWYLDQGLGRKSKDETIDHARNEIRRYVKGLYDAGQGEWDSSTYMMFGLHSLLNAYDFSMDEETRLIARAGIDWMATAYALKYRDGLFTGPNQRGHYDAPHRSIADFTGYVWFGSNHQPTDEELKRFLYAMHPITSAYRPNQVIYNLAKKNLPVLPIEFRNTKPNYWYGLNIEPRAGTYGETLYISHHYSMGTLWNGHGSQITRFQIVADSENGALSFTGGHPRRSDHTGKIIEFGYEDGIGRFDQSMQVGPTHITLTSAPNEEPFDYSFFKYPPSVEPTQHGDWWVMQAGKTFVAVRPVLGAITPGETDLSDKQKNENAKRAEKGQDPRHIPEKILKTPGRLNGFIVETADLSTVASLDAFIQSLQKTSLDADAFSSQRSISYTSAQGKKIEMALQDNSNNKASVKIDGESIDANTWPDEYDGAYVQQSDSVLRVNDGVNGFEIDFSGDLPVYRAFKP